MVPRSCKLCSSLGVDTKFASLDDQNKHAQIHASQLAKIHSEGDGDQVALEQIFANCFPLENIEEPMGPAIIIKEIEKSRSTLINICQRMIKANKNETHSIKCQLCKSNVRYCVRSNGKQKTRLILTHGCSHSTKKPFVCQQCQQETATKCNIVQHVKNCHKINSPISGVHFDERWTESFDEIKESLAKCLGLDDVDMDPGSRSNRRRSIFLRIWKSAKGAKKVRCDQCRTDVCAHSSRDLEQHVYSHMGRKIYKCTKCDYSSIHQSKIIKHLRREHGTSSAGNYISRSDDHHEEILEWSKKCFGEVAGE